MNKKKLQKPPRKYDQLYNTILTPDQEKVYQNWVNSLPINLRGDYDYDLRGAWLNGDVPSNNYHFTDKWKKPWHPTFSNESVYSTPGAEGGRWDGEEFHPSNLNRFIQDFKYGEWGANSFAKGGPKKTYTAEQLAAMANASQQAELQSMSPMSKTYTGPKIIQNDLTKKSIPSALQRSNAQTTLQNEEKIKSPHIPTISAAKEPWQYQSYNTLPNIEGWNREAENFGYALGSGHPMGINELNRYTLNTANLAGWVAAPEIMGLGESGYYFATKRPLSAALTWILGRFRPVANSIKNIKTNIAFNKSEFPQQVINDVQNAVNNDAKRYVERQLNEGNLAVREEFARQMQPKVKYDPSLTSWIKYNKNPFDWVKYDGLNVQGGQKIVMNPLALVYDPMAYKGLVAHEAKHSFKYLGMPDVAVETEKYFGPNKEFPLYDLIQPFEKASEKGLWRGSPDELLSEMANWKYQNNVLTTPYYMLDNETKNKLIKYASREFKINRLQTSNMLDGLSRFGLFKDGGSIHIKPENRGKFTAAAKRAGKSVQEYASQILANKDHYSSTLVKRANFARNFGGKK